MFALRLRQLGDVSMEQILEFVGPQRAVQLFGIRLVGMNAENGKKVLFTFVFIFAVWGISRILKILARRIVGGPKRERVYFWSRQAINIFSALILVLGVASIWFDDPTRLATALGLITAGLAFALQKVVTSFAGYFVILRGKTFNVGDRITMGGVRGDVIALDFTQTTLMEMGQPPAVQNADPAMWVKSREYTGRIVTVSNTKIFDEPVYNYTREFPFIWEEMSVPISYTADREAAENVLLEAAEKFSVDIAALSEEALNEMRRRYFVSASQVKPKVYCRLTDNWLELTVRFIVKERGMREIKDLISRHILGEFERKKISVASATFEIVGLPTISLQIPQKQNIWPSANGAQSQREQ